MRALDILKKEREIAFRIFMGDEYSDELESYKGKIEELDEAIRELEAHKDWFKSFVTHQKELAKQLEKNSIAYEFRQDGIIKLV